MLLRDNKIRIGEYEFLCSVDAHYGNRAVERHCNAEFELHIVLDGYCDMDVEDRTYHLERGTGLLIVPTSHHCPLAVSKSFVNFIFKFELKPYSAEASVMKKCAPCTRLEISDTALSLCKDIIRCTSEKPLYWHEALKARQTLLLCELARIFSPEAEERTVENDVADVRLGLIDNFFSEHYADKCDISTLAGVLHISERQLNRVLIKRYGMNFRKKLLRTRIDRAAFLLRTTDMSISQISETVGYLSETSFFKAFKGQCGTTPKLYRKEFNKKWN